MGWDLRKPIGCAFVFVVLALGACSSQTDSDSSDGLSQLASKQYQADEGSILNLQADSALAFASSAQWQQIGGPAAIVLSSSDTSLSIRVPDTLRSTTLEFLHSATAANNQAIHQRHSVLITPQLLDRVLLGPVRGATISARLLSDPETPIASAISRSGSELGYFSLGLADLPADSWLLLVVEGGEDTDADDDGHADQSATPNQGRVHALVQVADLNTGLRIGPLSEMAWQLLRSVLPNTPQSEWRTLLDAVGRSVLNGLPLADYSSLLRYSPFNPELVSALSGIDKAAVNQVAQNILQGTDETETQQAIAAQLPHLAQVPPRIQLDEVLYARRGREHRINGQAEQIAGTIESISWQQLSGSNLALRQTGRADPLLVVPEEFPEETLRYRLTVRNAQGLQVSSDIRINVTSQNLLPQLNAGADQTVNEQDLVQLDAIAVDLDGEIVSLSWQQISGPVVNLQPDVAEQTFIAPVTTSAVDVHLRLRGVDNEGGEAFDDLIVSVQPVNQAPLIQLPASQSVLEGRALQLFPEVSDPDGTIVSHSWAQIAGEPVEFIQADLEGLRFIAPATDDELEITVLFRVTDNEGASASRTVDIVVRDQQDNEAPVITMPTHLELPVGEAFLYSLLARDPDGDRVEFSVVDQPAWLSIDRFGRLVGQAPWALLGQVLPLQLRASDGELSATQTLNLNFAQTTEDETVLFRFLQQATFGPRSQDIAAIRQQGLGAWFNQQLSLPQPDANSTDEFISQLQRTEQIATSLFPDGQWEFAGEFTATGNRLGDDIQMAAWIEQALQGKDQLRQRVAYALSQILVTSSGESPLGSRAEALAHYADILLRHALGNYRDLLGEVARSPAMGVYLSHQGNKKFNEASNTHPDENFARELMQLFTIGLYQLNLDGSGRLDDNGQLIPSYSQVDIEEAARVMTGWDLRGNEHYGRASDTQGVFTLPMEFTDEHHDFGEKHLLGQVIPAGLSGDDDLDAVLDILFEHPNTAPFVARLLIQRMVTSNPSAGYIERVASAFESNVLGERGDMKAVVRAVLLDEEARDAQAAGAFIYGKFNEPLLVFTAFLRAFDVEPLEGWRINDNDELSQPAQGVFWFRGGSSLGQAPLRSPSVFNFYSPDFVPVATFFADRELVAPELQIRTPGNLTATHSLFQKLAERNAVIEEYGSVQAFAERERGWHRDGFVGLLDFTPLLVIFEQAMEGDSNGDFSQIRSEQVNGQGWTPKQLGILAMVDELSRRLTGRSAASEVQQAFAEELLSYSNKRNVTERQEAIDTVHAAAVYYVTSARSMIQK